MIRVKVVLLGNLYSVKICSNDLGLLSMRRSCMCRIPCFKSGFTDSMGMLASNSSVGNL